MSTNVLATLQSLVKSKSVLLLIFMGFMTSYAIAGTGPSMPWDSGLDTVVKNLTGRTALAVGIIALFAAGAALVFGGEMSDFTKRIILMVLVIALLVSGASIMNILFGVTGSLIPALA